MSDGAFQSVTDRNKNLPSTPPHSRYTAPPLFGWRQPVHALLGRSSLAHIILWKDPKLSAAILAEATALWVLFDWLGCHLVSLLSLALLIMIVVFFVWSKLAAHFQSSPPRVPKLQLSEDLVVSCANQFKSEFNRFMEMLRLIALGRDLKQFLKVEFSLILLSLLGGLYDFLTVAYIATVLVLTLPAIYERYEDIVDYYALIALRELQKLWKKFDQKIMSKIPRGPRKEAVSRIQ